MDGIPAPHHPKNIIRQAAWLAIRGQTFPDNGELVSLRDLKIELEIFGRR